MENAVAPPAPEREGLPGMFDAVPASPRKLCLKKIVFVGLVMAAFPATVWLLGTAVLWASPPLYRSAVIVQVDPSGASELMPATTRSKKPGVVVVEAQGRSLEEAHLKSLGYARDYLNRPDPANWLATGGPQSGEESNELRIVLGIGMLAFIGLLLSIPFLKLMDRAVPMRGTPAA